MVIRRRFAAVLTAVTTFFAGRTTVAQVPATLASDSRPSQRDSTVNASRPALKFVGRPLTSEMRLHALPLRFVARFTIVQSPEDMFSSKFPCRVDPISVMELVLTGRAAREVRVGLEYHF